MPPVCPGPHENGPTKCCSSIAFRLSAGPSSLSCALLRVCAPCVIAAAMAAVAQACAFVRFTTAEGAVAAIQAIHGKFIMPGCSDPLVVRYADAVEHRSRTFA